MSDVKTAGRTLELFEAYAEVKRPLPLLQLAARLKMPQSSCFALVRTLLARGYLYETGPRGGYYPTRRILDNAEVIVANDPVLDWITPFLEQLRSETGETIVFAKRQGMQVIYLAVVESQHTIRYSAPVGSQRPLHTTSLGKALLAVMGAERRGKILDETGLPRHTPRTIVSRAAFERDLAEAMKRGWYGKFGESHIDVGAVAVPVRIMNDDYAISVAGPLHRIEPAAAAHGRVLKKICAEIESGR